MTHVQIKSVSKRFEKDGRWVEVLKDISLSVALGETLCLLGPNGCGKTTLLNMVSGIESLTQGEITIGAKRMGDAKIGFVFQDYSASLFPWKTVQENVVYALECFNLDVQQAGPWLNVVGLHAFAGHYPYQLSGGQRQRLAIARALAIEPDVLVLDEPFSALDFSTKLILEEELWNLIQSTRATTLLVSHDIEQALFLSNQVAVLSSSPAKVKAVVSIDLPRKRTSETRFCRRFLELKKEVLNFYEQPTF